MRFDKYLMAEMHIKYVIIKAIIINYSQWRTEPPRCPGRQLKMRPIPYICMYVCIVVQIYAEGVLSRHKTRTQISNVTDYLYFIKAESINNLLKQHEAHSKNAFNQRMYVYL